MQPTTLNNKANHFSSLRIVHVVQLNDTCSHATTRNVFWAFL